MDVTTATITEPLALAHWRRSVAELYAGVRGEPESARAWANWSAGRQVLFETHPMSPITGGGAIPRYYDYDPAFRFEVETTTDLEERLPIPLDVAADGEVVLEPALKTIGLAETLGGELIVYWITGYGGGLFLPFKDATSGTGTYGGGRYLLDAIKGADLGMRDGRLVLDFNFAYNPSCSYSDRWTCPLSPAENMLPAGITAGEKIPT